jgi:hypothetical protein
MLMVAISRRIVMDEIMVSKSPKLACGTLNSANNASARTFY